jgi:hypothetical protein
MFRRFFCSITLIVATVATAQPVLAASSSAPVSLSLGVNFPSQSYAQDVGGSTQFALNGSFALTPTTPKSAALYLFLDYTGGGNSGRNENSVGGGIGVRTTDQIYGGLDLGVFGTTVNLPIITPEGVVPGTFSQGTTGGGGRIYIGANLTPASARPVLFVEGGYRFLPSVNGVNPSGFGVSIGGRF